MSFTEASAQASEAIASSPEPSTTDAAEQAAVQQPSAPVQETAPSEEVEHSFETVDDAVKELKKVRAEAAERRIALKNYEDAFGQYGDEDRQVWFQLATLLAQDTKSGAEAMKQIAEGLLGTESTEEEKPVSEKEKGAAEQAAEAAEALTPEKVQEIVQASLTQHTQTQQQEQAQQQKLEAIRSKAKELGYEHGGPDYTALLNFAAHETNGDLDAAHKKVEEWKQGIVKSFTDAKGDKAERTASVPPPSSGTPEPEAPKPPSTMKEARSKVLQFLDDQARGAATGS